MATRDASPGLRVAETGPGAVPATLLSYGSVPGPIRRMTRPLDLEVPMSSASLTRRAVLERLGFLDLATPDKGGHRVKAIELVNSAITETQAGIGYDATH